MTDNFYVNAPINTTKFTLNIDTLIYFGSVKNTFSFKRLASFEELLP